MILFDNRGDSGGIYHQKASSQLAGRSLRLIVSLFGIFNTECRGLDLPFNFYKSTSLSLVTWKCGFIFLEMSSC
jgi:hypothetical protein